MKFSNKFFATITTTILGASLLFSSASTAFASEAAVDVSGAAEASVGIEGTVYAALPSGILQGHVWEDVNANGLRDAGEPPLPGLQIQLEQATETGWKPVHTMHTDANGQYQVEATHGQYRLAFPPQPGKIFTLFKAQDATHSTQNCDVGQDGLSPAVVLNAQTDPLQVDAGYAKITLPDSDTDFMAKIVLPDQLTQYYTVTNPSETVTIRIFAKMNAMAGYQSLGLQNILDARLAYRTARVFAAGQDITALGALSFQQETNTVQYQFATPLDASLAEQVIQMDLEVAIKENIHDFSDIVNHSTLTVNSDHHLQTKAPVVLHLAYGFIQGYVFEDLNANGLRDEQSRPMNGVIVQCLDQNQREIARATTSPQGKFQFISETAALQSFPFGDYTLRLVFNEDMKRYQFTQKQVTGAGFDGFCSDAEESGDIALTLSAARRLPMAGFGLTEKEKPPEKEDLPKDFVKTSSVRDAKSGDRVQFNMSGFGNYSSQTLERCGISDIVPEGLEFQDGYLPAFTKGAGVTYSVECLTRQSSSPIVVQTGIPADRAYHFKAPSIAPGDRISVIRVRMDSVPAGFGQSNTAQFNFVVSKGNTNHELVNSGMWFEGDQTVSTKSSSVKDKKISKDGKDIEAEEAALAAEEKDNSGTGGGFDGGITTNPGFDPDNDGRLIPLARTATSWSLLNIILLALSFLSIGLILVLWFREHRQLLERRFRPDTAVKLALGTMFWMLSLFVFLHTQNWRGYMVLVNSWTGILTLLLSLALLSLVSGYKSTQKQVHHQKVPIS